MQKFCPKIPSSHDRKFSGRKSFYFSLSHFIFRLVFYFPQIIQMRVSRQFFIHFYLSIKYAKKSNIFQLIGTQMCRKGREKLYCSSLCGTKVSFFLLQLSIDTCVWIYLYICSHIKIISQGTHLPHELTPSFQCITNFLRYSLT